MDAAYCSAELRARCKDLGHVPLIDHNPRGCEKIEFGGNHIWVKGNTKVMSYLMFGLLVLTVDQLMRLLQ